MKQFIVKNKKMLLSILAIFTIAVATMSFQDSPFMSKKFDVTDNFRDTVPEKGCDGSVKLKDLDNLNEELDKSLANISEGLKKIDLDKLMNDVGESLKNINLKDVSLSLKKIDFDDVLADIKSSLQNIRWEDKEEEMEKALEEAREEMEKAKQEIKNIDTKNIDAELEKARKEIEKSKLEIKKIDFDKIMSEAKIGIDKAKEEIKQIKTMFEEMEKDGLIDRENGFSVEYKDKNLYIDGKKQSDRITDKYRHYFKEDRFKIKIDKE